MLFQPAQQRFDGRAFWTRLGVHDQRARRLGRRSVWRCETCGQLVDEEDFELCWNCSAARADLPPDVEEPPALVWRVRTTERPVAVLQAIRLGFRTVVQHPTLLLGAVPLLVWGLAESSGVGRSGGAFPRLWGADAVLGVLTAGFVYAFVAAAVRDRPSIARAVAWR